MKSENPNQEHTEPERGERPANNNRSEPAPQVSPVSRSTETNPPQSPQSENVASHAHRDWHDYAMLIVQGVGVVFLIAYTTFAALQWCEMRKTVHQSQIQSKIAMQQLEASERPWLSVVVDIDGPLVFKPTPLVPGVPNFFIRGETGAMITIKFTLINKGHSPAESTWIIPVVYPETAIHSAKDEQTNACGTGSLPLPLNSSIGPVILPGDKLESIQTIAVKKTDVDAAVAEFRKRFENLRPGLGSKVKPSITFFVTGCVAYQSSFTNAAVVGSSGPVKKWQTAYQTGFSYRMLKRTSQGFNPDDGDVPVQSLALVPNPFWGFYAY